MTQKKPKPAAKPAAQATAELETWALDDITPYDKNHKFHDDEQIQDLMKIIEAYGYSVPIVVDKHGVIINGHGRFEALKRLGKTQTSVIVKRDLSDEQVAAMRLSDNLIARRGKIDTDLVRESVIDLAELGIDLSLMGFDGKEIETINADWLQPIDLEIDALIAQASEKKPEPASAHTPESIQAMRDREQDYEPSYQVVIVCSGEAEQRDVYEKMTAEGRECRVQTL